MNKQENNHRIKNVFRLTGRLKEYWANMLVVIFAGVGHQLSTVGVAMVGAWIVGLALEGTMLTSMRKIIAVTVIAVTAKIVFYGLEMWVAHDVAFKVLADFRIRLFDAIERVSPAILLDMRTGQLASTMMSDVELLEWFFAHSFGSVIVAAVSSVLLLLWLGTIHPSLSIILIGFIILAVIIPMLMKKRADEQGARIREELGEANAVTVEGVQGLREILALNYKEEYEKKNAWYISRLYESQLAHGKRLGTEGALLQAVMGMAGIVTAMIASGYVNSEKLDMSVYTMIVVLSGMILGPVVEVCNTARNFGLIFAAADRVYRVLESRPMVEDRGEDVDINTLTADIAFEHVDFRYRPELEKVLKNVSFQIGQGEIVALAGHSGAGKSTCLQMMMRYWDPEHGSIRIGGKNLTDISIASLNKMMSVVLQDVYLFQISIRENIRIGRLSATDEEVEQAARLAFAHEFIQELPEGYDTVCGEGGVKLSGGQRQRVAIARAFLKDAPILLMDEAVSNLDTENEKEILDGIRSQKSGKTVVIVAHRVSTLQAVDRILLFDHGELVQTKEVKAVSAI